MKKIILSLFVMLSLSTFTQEKYRVEIEPSAKISQSVISNYNSQIEKEVSRIYSKEEMFGMMNKMDKAFKKRTVKTKNIQSQFQKKMKKR